MTEINVNGLGIRQIAGDIPTEEERQGWLAELAANSSNLESASASAPMPNPPSPIVPAQPQASPIGKEIEIKGLGLRPIAGDVPTEEERRGFVEELNQTPDLNAGEVVLGAARTVVDGATLGWSNELAALAKSTIYDSSYMNELEGISKSAKAFRKAYPKVALAGELMGAVGTGGASLTALLSRAAIKALPRSAQIALSGVVTGTEGAIAGAGTAEPGFRGPGAERGALFGATLGMAIPGAADVLRRRVWEPIATRLSSREKQATAIEYLRRLAQLDGNTVGQVAEKMRAKGGAATPIDTGTNVESLGEYLAQRPGAGRTEAVNFVASRRGEQYGRLMSALEKAILPAGKTAAVRVDDSPPFREALEKSIPLPEDLLRIMKRPSMRAAWEQARKLAAEGDIDVRSFDSFRDGVLNETKASGRYFDLSDAGKIVGVETELMHYLKKGLDDVLEPQRDVTGKLTASIKGNELRAIQKTRKSFREIVKKLNPAYGKQLDLISLDKQLDNAFKKGEDFLKYKKATEIHQILSRMSPRERRSFQMGASSILDENAYKRAAQGDDASKFLASHKRKLQAMFGGKAYRDLGKTLDNEIEFMRAENRVGKGSQTMSRKNTAEMVEGGAPELAQLAATASTQPVSALNRIATSMFGPTRPSAPVTEEMARILFSQNPRLIDAIARQSNSLPVRLRSGVTPALSALSVAPGIVSNR